MNVFVRYALDGCEIEERWKQISVRSRMQKWITVNGEDVPIELEAGFHRIVLLPGDWEGADKWGVRHYADLVWTPAVIEAWKNRPNQTRNPFPTAQ